MNSYLEYIIYLVVRHCTSTINMIILLSKKWCFCSENDKNKKSPNQ